MSRTDRPPYPPDWKAIVERVRIRSGGRCECTGECGNPHLSTGTHRNPRVSRCNAPDGELILRVPGSPWIWDRHTPCSLCMGGGHRDAGDPREPVKVKLTTAHIRQPVESGNHELENLKHLCQRCHLLLDLDHHQANAAATRRRHLRNLELFP